MTAGTAPRRIVIVGAGLAGLRSAEALRRAGFEGELVIIGDEPHGPYNRPPLSKKVLVGAGEAADVALASDGVKAEWLLARPVRGLDVAGRRVLLDDAAMDFDALVIATGCRPRTLPGLPALEGICVLRTLDDALALRSEMEDASRLVVVGAGFLGCEVAASARGLGLRVTMVDIAAAPMPRMAPPLGRFAAHLHREHDVDLRLGAGVAAMTGQGRVRAVALTDGTTVAGDLVLVALGAVPATDWLERSGVGLDDGVLCDAWGFAAPQVVAVGDVARWPHPHREGSVRIEHWSNASEMARGVVPNLLKPAEERLAYRPVPSFWSEQYGHRFQSFGFADLADRFVEVDADGLLVEGYRGEELVCAAGVDAGRAIMGYRNQLAQQSARPDAVV